jgi:hypothetical protein
MRDAVPHPNPSPPLRYAPWGEGEPNRRALLTCQIRDVSANRLGGKYPGGYEVVAAVAAVVAAGAGWLGTLYWK